jgi:tetratricopeptide (TPR) repeat protein
MADRYMYFPLVGLSVAVVWWAWDAAQRAPRGRAVFVAVATICVAMLAPVSRRQVSFWKDSETLFTHAMSVTGKNSKMLYCRGIDSANRGEWARAEADFTGAIALAPSYTKAYLQRGVVYYNVGKHDGAIADFTTALTLKPDDAEAHNTGGTSCLPGAIIRGRSQIYGGHANSIRVDFVTTISAPPTPKAKTTNPPSGASPPLAIFLQNGPCAS